MMRLTRGRRRRESGIVEINAPTRRAAIERDYAGARGQEIGRKCCIRLHSVASGRPAGLSSGRSGRAERRDHGGQRAEGREQKAESRRQRAEGREQKEESRRKKEEGRRQKEEG